MKTIKLSVEQARELYNTNKEFRDTILHEFTDSELGIEPLLRDYKHLDFNNTYAPKKYYDLLVPSHKHCNSMIAFARLSMLMHDLGDECLHDWCDEDNKYVIDCHANKIITYVSYHFYYLLAFKTESIRDAFLEKHERLIKDYFMLD